MVTDSKDIKFWGGVVVYFMDQPKRLATVAGLFAACTAALAGIGVWRENTRPTGLTNDQVQAIAQTTADRAARQAAGEVKVEVLQQINALNVRIDNLVLRKGLAYRPSTLAAADLMRQP